MNRNIRLLSLFNFFDNFRPGSVIAILFFAEVSGSYALGMSVFSIVWLSSAFFEIPTGVFSDLIGRKKTLIFGAFVSFIASIIFAMSYSYLALVVAAIAHGLSMALFSGNNDSLLHDALRGSGKEKEFANFLGKMRSVIQIGGGVSAVLGSVLAEWSFRWTMWAAVLPVFLSFLVGFFIEETRKFKNQERANIFSHLQEAFALFRKNSRVRTLTIIKTWFYAIDEASYHFNSAFVKLVWPVWAIGIRRILGKALGAASFYWSGKIIKKFGAEKIINLRSLGDHGTRFIALFFPSVFSPILMSANSFFWATGQVAENALLQKEFSDRQRSTQASLSSLLDSVGFALAAYLLGIAGDVYGPIKALIIFQLAKVPLSILVWKFYRASK